MDNAVIRPPTRTMKPHRLMGSPKLGGLNQLNIAQIARVGCKPLHTALRSAPDRGRRIWDASDSGRADTVIDDADRLRDAHRPVVRGIENADLAAASGVVVRRLQGAARQRARAGVGIAAIRRNEREGV